MTGQLILYNCFYSITTTITIGVFFFADSKTNNNNNEKKYKKKKNCESVLNELLV